MSVNLSFDAVSIPSDLMSQHCDWWHCSPTGTDDRVQATVAGDHSETGHGNGGAAAEMVSASRRSKLRHIEMSFANAIPFRISVGRITTTPIVILLSQDEHPSIAADDIWVFVSLVDAESELWTGDDVLLGQRADNAHSILGHLSQSATNLAYVSFPDLIISKPGRFRLCVTAIDTSMGQSYVLPAIISEPIEVVDTKLMGSHDISTEALLRLSVNLHA